MIGFCEAPMKDKNQFKAQKRLLPWVGGGCSAHPQPTPPLHQEKGCGKRNWEKDKGRRLKDILTPANRARLCPGILV